MIIRDGTRKFENAKTIHTHDCFYIRDLDGRPLYVQSRPNGGGWANFEFWSTDHNGSMDELLYKSSHDVEGRLRVDAGILAEDFERISCEAD